MKPITYLLGLPIVQEISSKRRRTITIYVRDNAIVVRTPTWTTKNEVISLVRQRTSWIKRQIELRKFQVDEQTSEHRGVELPAKLCINGVAHVVRYEALPALSALRNPCVRTNPGLITLQGSLEQLGSGQAKDLLTHWLREAASQTLPERVAELCRQLHCTVHAVRIKELKSRWGSCSVKSNINLNWRLILAPPSVRDYVIVHELCHLQEMNHSSHFWNLVKHAMPDYESKRQWLKVHGQSLYF